MFRFLFHKRICIVIKKLLFLSSVIFCAISGQAENLLPNSDFQNGFAGYYFGDNLNPEKGIPFPLKTEWGTGVTFTATARRRMGISLPVVPIRKGVEYELSFMAKSNHVEEPLIISEYTLTGSRAKFNVKLTDQWRRYSFHFTPDQKATWGGFRILRGVSDTDCQLSFARFFLGPPDGKTAGPFSTELAINQRQDYRFQPDEPITVELRIFNHISSEAKACLRWRLVSLFYGRMLETQTIELSLAPGITVYPIQFKAPHRNDLYRIEAVLDDSPVTQALQYFAITPHVRVRPGELPVDLGINSPLTFSSICDVSNEELQILAESGISILRMWDSGNPFVWSNLEPIEGDWNWTRCDQVMAAARKAGLRVMINLGGMFFRFPPGQDSVQHGLPNWLYEKSKIIPCFQTYFMGEGRSTALPPMKNWEELVRAVVSRYARMDNIYEILNEPNLFMPETEYVPYLRTAARIIRCISPNSPIVGICATGDASGSILSYVKTAIGLGSLQEMTDLSFHPYNCRYEDSPVPGDETIRALHTLLKEQGRLDIGIWNTELYYLAPGDEEDPSSAHPGWLIRRYLLDASQGVKGSILLPGGYLLTFVPSVNANFYHSAAPGLLGTKGFIPTTKYIATAVFAGLLKGTSFTCAEDLPGSARIYRFTGTGKEVAALFLLNNVTGDQRRLLIPQIPKGIRILDIMGNDIPASGDSVELPASPFPCWINGGDPQTMDELLKRVKVIGIVTAQLRDTRVSPRKDGGKDLHLVLKILKKNVPFEIAFPDAEKYTFKTDSDIFVTVIPFPRKIPEKLSIDGKTEPLSLNGSISIPHVASEISVESNCFSPEWAEVPFLELNGGNVAKVCVSGGFLWFSVFMNTPVLLRKSEAELSRSSSVEILLDTQPLKHLERSAYRSGKTHRFLFAPAFGVHEREITGSTNFYRKFIRWDFHKHGKGYVLTAGFPLRDFRMLNEPFIALDIRLNEPVDSIWKVHSLSGYLDSHKNRFRFLIGSLTYNGMNDSETPHTSESNRKDEQERHRQR